jgi:hypothetical protein
MNKRIQELAEQANGSFGTGQEFAVVFGELEDFNKFAELIVKECAEIAHCNFHVDGVTLGNIMKERFGVEE